jgi:hypothetical protein
LLAALGLPHRRFEDLGDAALRHRRAAGRIDIVTALHACDTATDDAIAFGLAKRHGCWCLLPGGCGALKRSRAEPEQKTHAGRGWWRHHPLHARVSRILAMLRCLRPLEPTAWRHRYRAGRLGTLDENEVGLASRPKRITVTAKPERQVRLHAVLQELGGWVS